MPSIKERLARILYGEKITQLESLSYALERIYANRPYLIGDARLREQLDSQTWSNVQRHLSDVRLSYMGAGVSDEAQRRNAVEEATFLHSTDPMTHRMVSLWTDFGLGQTVEIAPLDEAVVVQPQEEDDGHLNAQYEGPEGKRQDWTAKQVWAEFWTADRNMPLLRPRRLHRLSDLLLIEGELFLPFWVSKVDGECTIRRIPSLEITNIVTDPDDNEVPIWYRRQWIRPNETVPTVAYYPDWNADEKQLQRTLEAIRKKEDQPTFDQLLVKKGYNETTVIVLHAAHNTLTMRGWPITYASAPWIRAYKNFLQDRAALARAVASIVNEITVEGGERAVEFFRDLQQSSLVSDAWGYETNPPPPAGSDFVHNPTTKLTRMPFATAAGDAQIDGAAIEAMAGLGAGIFPHWLGRGEAFRLATAVSMDPPIFRMFNRYQEFWSDLFREMVDLVLTMHEKYPQQKRIFETHSAEVSLDPLIDEDLGRAYRALRDLHEARLIPDEPAMRKALELLGFKNVEEIIRKYVGAGETPQPPERKPVAGTAEILEWLKERIGDGQP